MVPTTCIDDKWLRKLLLSNEMCNITSFLLQFRIILMINNYVCCFTYVLLIEENLFLPYVYVISFPSFSIYRFHLYFRISFFDYQIMMELCSFYSFSYPFQFRIGPTMTSWRRHCILRICLTQLAFICKIFPDASCCPLYFQEFNYTKNIGQVLNSIFWAKEST